jgi:hypothetical protein
VTGTRLRATAGGRVRGGALLASTCSLALLTTSVASSGAPAKTPAPDPEPALPPPHVTLTVTPGSSGGPWRLQIENQGEGPVRIAADPRLLIFELTPPAPAAPEATKPEATSKKKAPAPAAPRCILPDDARPSTDDGRELVIPPKRSWSATFDPLFYCFGARERAALVPGTSVKTLFGWPAPPPRAGAKPGKAPTPAPPFAVTPVGASVGKVAAAKVIEAPPVVLTEAVPIAKTGNDTGDDTAQGGVTLSVPETMDAARGGELATTVTLTNGTDRPITLLYRPEMLQFSVSGPAGSVSCGSAKTVAAPIRELFTTVPVKGKTATSVLVTTTCPAGTFDEPGIYRIVPRLDTTNASGRKVGLKTWDGTAVGTAPLLLRVRSPRKPALPPRPALD